MKTMRAAALCLTPFVLLAGCKKKPAPEQDLAPVNLDTTIVHTSSASATLSIPAHVEADPTHLVHVFAPLSGQILSLNVVAGQQVSKGQTIAMLRSGDVAASRADFEKAKIEAERADRARDRGKMLMDHEVLSQAAFYELQATADGAHAELDRTRQRLRELGFAEKSSSDIAPIQSPISGTVLEVGTAAGEMQRSLETSNGIATIANLGTVWVVGDVYERDLALLKRAEHVDVTVQAYPGEVFHGTLANLGDVFDPATHTLRARVVLANADRRLKPAMFATLEIARPAVSAILVPQSAVIHNGDSTAVYLQGADGKFQLHQVGVGSSSDGKVEITAGLKDGDRIVTSGAAFLRTPTGD